jgi:hypothetical protein
MDSAMSPEALQHRMIHRAVRTTPPGVVNAAVDSTFAAYETVVTSATDYWTSALSSGKIGADVLIDVLDWTAAVADRNPPRWSTRHEVRAQWPVARLLEFPHPDPDSVQADALPVLFLPPQAGWRPTCSAAPSPGTGGPRAGSAR